jgi:hypothetical protein
MLIFLQGCSNKPIIEYRDIEVPVPVEVVKVVKQSHSCIQPNPEFKTWGELLIAYRKLQNAFDVCLMSLE